MGIQEVLVIGAGTMGNGIAHVFAQTGFDVVLFDSFPAAAQKGLATIEKNLDRQLKKGKITEEDVKQTLGHIKIANDISEGKNADLAVEAIIENKTIKLELFRLLDSTCKPEAILASNTSTISITEIAASTKRADKVIGMHFMNPVPMMKLVEIIRGLATSDETYEVINISADFSEAGICDGLQN